MAHRCVKCGKIYESTAQEILKGCDCGSHFFFFFKEDDLRSQKAEERFKVLNKEEREEIMQDVKEIIGDPIDKPIILNIESIRVDKPGKFELDLVSLFKRKPIIYKLEEGKYIVDLASSFQMLNQNKDKDKDKNMEEWEIGKEEFEDLNKEKKN